MEYVITKKDIESMSQGNFLTIDGGHTQYRAEKPPNRNGRHHILSLAPAAAAAFMSITSTLPKNTSMN